VKLHQVRPLFENSDKLTFVLAYRERRYNELLTSRQESMVEKVRKELKPRGATKPKTPTFTADQLAALKEMGLI